MLPHNRMLKYKVLLTICCPEICRSVSIRNDDGSFRYTTRYDIPERSSIYLFL